MTLSRVVDALIAVFEEQKPTSSGDAHFAVSRTVSALAVLYEKARNAVEFRAEHLVRRAAIERILKRRILLNGGSQTIAENLLIELLWAKYIDSSLLDDAKKQEIQQIINRYLTLKQSSGGHSWETFMALASSEIEETLVSAKRREALNNFFYQAIRPKIELLENDERFTNIQTYIAIERAYAQADDALITYHLMRMVMPDWFTGKNSDVSAQASHFIELLGTVKAAMRHPVSEPLYRFIRRRTPPYLLIRDLFLEAGDKIRDIVQSPEELEKKLSEVAGKRYQEIGAKVRRAVVRSIIYIFLTKMLFALALEAPVDIFITKKIEYLSLAINALFPPVLLFAIAGLISVPGTDNTRRLIDRIKKIFYHFDELKDEPEVFQAKFHERRPILTAVFSVFYLATFLISYGLISFMLTKLHFNIASQIIFVFFTALVSFFAYRIRQSAKEYEMLDRQGFLGPLVDFFFLPVLRVGHVLSREVARLNIFIYFFDFILEAPLKVIFEVVEEWIRFIRVKKEEII